MRFNCDYFSDKRDAKRKAKFKWHRFFALWPRKIAHGDCRWMETIERKRNEGYYHDYWTYRGL